MEDSTHLVGGFNLSHRMAMTVIEAVDEIQLGNIDPELSHLSNDSCGLCKAAREREKTHDASQANRPRLARSA